MNLTRYAEAERHYTFAKAIRDRHFGDTSLESGASLFLYARASVYCLVLTAPRLPLCHGRVCMCVRVFTQRRAHAASVPFS